MLKKKKQKIDPLVDDPFAGQKKKKYGFWVTRRLRKNLELQEKIRAEDAFLDLKLREAEIAALETEEKLGWDGYELPSRNRLRMIREFEAKQAVVRENAAADAKTAKREKEEGFTSFNGVVQEFARHKDSPALFHTYVGHTQRVNAFKISSDFNYFVSASSDCTVKLWDLNTQKCVRTLEGHSKVVFDCDLESSFTKETPSGGRIVSASADRTIRIWDAFLGACRKVIRGHTDVVFSCAFTPDGTRIASASADRSLRLWDADEGHLIYVFGGHDSGAPLCCCFSPSGKYLLSASDYGERSIKLWYTDMPHMEQKQVVGFRIIWEVTGVMRRLVVKYDPKPGFFVDKVSAKQEISEEDAADEAWDLEHPPDLLLASGAEGDTEEEVEEAKAAARAKEEETLALELPDTPEAAGFSISVNSLDRFRRPSQVKSYYPGVELQVVLRGADPFKQFFVSSHHKRAQFEAFEERSGDRVGSFALPKDQEEEADGLGSSSSSLGAKLCCGGKGACSPSRGLTHATHEMALTWRAPTLKERAAPGANIPPGAVVMKATLMRDPLSVGPDEEDPGMVQVSYTLTEVEIPKKGRLLTEMGQKIEKEEKKFTADVVANHQLFIDFVRNGDVFSAGTLLGERVHMYIDSREIQGRDKVMEVLEDLMMQEDCAVILKDAKFLCNGATSSSLDRDKAVDTKKKGLSGGSVSGGGGEGQEESDSDSDSDEDEDEEAATNGQQEDDHDQALSARALRRAMLDAAPPGPKKWSAGPAKVNLLRPHHMLHAAQLTLEQRQGRQRKGGLLRTILGSASSSKVATSPNAVAGGGGPSSAAGRKGLKGARNVSVGEATATDLRARAESEVDRVLGMRRWGVAVSEEVREERMLPSSAPSPWQYLEEEEEELVKGGNFGVNSYRMRLPSIYPATAMVGNKAVTNAKKVLKHVEAQMERERRRREKSSLPRFLFWEQREQLVQEMMMAMAASEAEGKAAAMERRESLALLPAFESMSLDLNDAGAVKGSVLGTRLPESKGEIVPSAFVPTRQKKMPTIEDGFDPDRRRNAFPSLPGFRSKREEGDFGEATDLDELKVARSHGRRGLIRTFVVETFGSIGGGGSKAVVDTRVHHNSINQVAFSLDEKRVASASGDATVRLWDTKSGRLVSTLIGHERSVTTVAFSDEGQRLASSGLDNFLILWNVATGVPLRRLYGHDDAVRRVAFFNDSTALLSCSGDKTLRVWYLTPQPPAAPGKPRVSSKSTQSMTLAWKAPPAFNEGITAFHIQYRVGIREEFGHDMTSPGDEHSFVVKGLRPSTPYQFRVRGVNRMGEGRWSDPSAQTVTAIDVPDAFERPEVLEVTPYGIGIKWRAPTATIEGTSIGRFVIQIAGAGLSYDDNVQQVITWGEGRLQLQGYEERQAANAHLSHLAVGQTTNRNLEILRETKAKRSKFQEKLLAREREKREKAAMEEQRRQWERGTASNDSMMKTKKKKNDEDDPEAEEKRREKSEEKKRRQRRRDEKSVVLAQGGGSPRALSAAHSLSLHEEGEDPSRRGEGGGGGALVAPRTRASGTSASSSSSSSSSLSPPKQTDPGDGEEEAENQNQKKKSHQNLVEHFFLYEELRPGYMYRLRVAGVSSMGQGKWTPTTFSMTTLPTEPARPDPPVVHPKHVHMFGLRVEWLTPDENGSAIASFTVRCCHDGSEVVVSQNSAHLDVGDLEPGERYTFQVRASNQQGSGPWSEESEAVYTLTSKAEAPNPPAVLPDTGIDWVDLDAVRPFANGSPVVGWIVQSREISMTSHSTWGAELTLPLVEVLDDADDDEDDSGEGGELGAEEGGSTFEGDTQSAAMSSFDRTVLQLKRKGRRGSYKNQEEEERDAATSSSLVRSGGGRGGKELLLLPRCRLCVTGLRADTTYDFRVRALNEHGASEWSTASKRGRTKPPLKPSAPAKLFVDELHPNAVVCSWEEPASHGAEIMFYEVEQQRTARGVSNDSESDEESVASVTVEVDEDVKEAMAARKKERDKDLHVIVSTASGNVFSLRLDDLTTYSTYKFRVAATNEVGTSPWSPWTPEIQPTDDCLGDPVKYD